MELLLLRYSNPCLRLFVVILQDLRCLQRFYHNVDHWGIEVYYHKKFHSHLADLDIGLCDSINNIWPEAIFVYFTRNTLFTKIFNMTMHYPQWNYITVPSFMFRYVTVSELCFFKQKKKMENLQNGLLLI